MGLKAEIKRVPLSHSKSDSGEAQDRRALMNHLEGRQQYQRRRDNNDWQWLPTRNLCRRTERDLNEGYTLYYAPKKGYTPLEIMTAKGYS